MAQLVAELRRGTPGVGRFLIVVGAAMAAGAIYLAMTVAREGAILCLFALGPMAIGAWGLVHRLRIFDDGVEVWTFFGRTKILFSEAERLTYRIVEKRIRGDVRASLGYYVGFVLRGGGRKVTYLGRLEGNHPAHLEAVRDRIASIIADRGGEALARGETFNWLAPRGSQVTLENGAITYRARRFVGYGQKQIVPYSAAFTYYYVNDLFVLHSAGAQMFMESANGDNFYPGLDLLARLVGRDGGSLARKDP